MKFRQTGFAILLSVFLWITGFSQSQEYSPAFISKDFLYQNWSIRDGLPVNSISSITQSSDGYLWLGTADGLARFDGVRFKLYRTANYPGLKYNRIKGVAAYDQGVLVLNSRGELFRFENNVFIEEQMPVLKENPAGNTLIRRSDGVIEIRGRDLYITFSGGNFEAGEAQQNRYPSTRKAGNFSWRSYSSIISLNGEVVLDIQDQINDALLDHEGSLWIASYSKGLYRVKINSFEVISEAEGLPGRNIYPVTESDDGRIWIGTHGKGLASYLNGEVTTGYLFQGTSSESYVQSILQKSNGDLMVALLGGGLYKYSGEKIFLKTNSEFPAPINCLFEDSRGYLWVGTESGLYRIDDEGQILIDEPEIVNARIMDIVEAPDQSIWIATNGLGVFQMKQASVHGFDKDDGLTSNAIRSLWIPDKPDPNSYMVWAGTEGSGLNMISVENGAPVMLEVSKISTGTGLYDDVIHKIIPDDQGRVWMSSNHGIFWVYSYELEEYGKGTISKITSTGYTEEDGLRNREANGGVQPAGVKTENGDIWFPTQDGVVRVTPSEVKRNEQIPPVYIEEAISNEQSLINNPSEINLSEDDRDLTIKFTALSFLSPVKNKFSYRLFGYDKEWQDPVLGRNARYTNLEPGTYTFKVIASNNDGVWNPQGDLLTITVAPHFYEATWFYLLVGSLLFLQAIVAYLIIRERAKKEARGKMREVEEMQKKLAQVSGKLLEQEQLKRSFLFNLKKELREPVISLIEQADSGKESLEKLVDRESRKMLKQVDQMLLLSEIEIEGISLNPTIENLVGVVKSCIVDHKHEAEPDDPVIEFSSNTDKVNIYLEHTLAKMIFDGLIKNAVESPDVQKIRIQVIEESSICTVKITDDGEALGHRKLHSIFSLFQTNEVPGDERSTVGLTLPLVARLVELHKATIVVHSIPEMGNTFSVSFKKGSLHFEFDNEVPFENSRN